MTIHITLGAAGPVGSATVLYSQPRVSETVSSAGTQSTARGQAGEVWSVTATVDLFVEIAVGADGAGTTRHRLAANERREFLVTVPGEGIAFQTT